MKQAEMWFNRLTLEQKLGQMICIRAAEFEPDVYEKAAEGIVGAAGAVLFAKHKSDPAELVRVLNNYNARSPVPLLFYLDAEQGVSGSLSCGTAFPSMMALGATFSQELAYKMGRAIAREARAMGFGIVGNPVLDINSNPSNPIINTRAISDRVEHIVELAKPFVDGMQDALVIPTGKHYPGHGDTSVDSHIAMPIVTRSVEQLMAGELAPFRELVRLGMMGIMTAHILFPALTPQEETGLPATLSKSIITGMLRERFGFEGLIVSDSLTMKSVKDRYGVEKAAVMAVQAGNDILLQDYQSDPEITFRALLRAVEKGDITRRHIDASVNRILRVKERFQWLENRRIDLEEAKAVLACPEHIAAAQAVASRSVTVLEAARLPLSGRPDEKVLLVTTRSEADGQQIQDMDGKVSGKNAYLYEQVKQYAPNVEMCVVSEAPTEEERERVEALLRSGRYHRVLYAAFVRVLSYKAGSGTIPQAQFEFIRKVKSHCPSMIFVVFGSPYILRELDRFENCLCAYGDNNYSIDATIDVLFGKRQPTGRLPVRLDDRYDFGYGLTELP